MVEHVKSVLSDETKNFWSDSSIEYLENPSLAEFLKISYSCYKPVILKRQCSDWPCMSHWNKTYFIERFGQQLVDINITPDGWGDCVKECSIDGDIPREIFVYPAEARITMKHFFDQLDGGKLAAVPYLSHQNDNIRVNFGSILEDIPSSIPLADEAFDDKGPEAINLWIGDERSISSIHKDFFENFYAVVEGEKVFTLLPPTDILFMPEKEFPTAKYVIPDSRQGMITKDELSLSPDCGENAALKWIPLDPDDPQAVSKYPQFRYASPLRCKVLPGEILYIPAMWYHRVTQTKLTIAVNYWYDMRFDFRYTFYQTIKALAESEAEKGKT